MAAASLAAGADAAVGRREGRRQMIGARHAQPLRRRRRVHPEKLPAESCILPRRIHGLLVMRTNISTLDLRHNASAMHANALLKSTPFSINLLPFPSHAFRKGERWEHALRAKKTEAPRKSGGSPTAFEECTCGVRRHGASRSSVTRRSSGMSFAVGILYVPAQHFPASRVQHAVKHADDNVKPQP